MLHQSARNTVFIGQAATDVLAACAAPAIGVGTAAIERTADFIGAGRDFRGLLAAIAGAQDAMGIVLAADDGFIADIAPLPLALPVFAEVFILTAIGIEGAHPPVRVAAAAIRAGAGAALRF